VFVTQLSNNVESQFDELCGYDKLLFRERYFKTSMKKFGYWILADSLRPVPVGSNEIIRGLY